MTSPQVSVIVPFLDAEATLTEAIDSVLGRPGDEVELIAVDDGSRDGGAELVRRRAVADPRLQVATSVGRQGPGIARNVGLQLARGRWILFLDADDQLTPGALDVLLDAVAKLPDDTEALGFDWAPLETGRPARKDQRWLQAPTVERLQRYLALQMDGSVIYTAMRRDFIERHGLRFRAGLHEDVDFLFLVYALARRIDYVDACLYLKRSRPDSIVATISEAHLEGFLAAWLAVLAFVEQHPELRQQVGERVLDAGRSAVVATRAREIHRHGGEAAPALYARLAELSSRHFPHLPQALHVLPPTRYNRLTRCLLASMAEDAPVAERAARITQHIDREAAMSWSCTDLAGSLFLAPDQLRTCCKRFFVDGEMRGDVVLLDLARHGGEPTPERILAAKQGLHAAINRGDETPCSGCPFLEYRDWAPLDRLQIDYLSLEYQTTCNLRCTYCSETYYSGQPASYDVPALLSELSGAGVLAERVGIVWGGGEPTADRSFEPISRQLAEARPQAQQRVLTNAVKFNARVADMLREGQATVTTSIDAGTPQTFLAVRGKPKLEQVLRSLRRYAEVAAERVTIKYIFTEGNTSLEECAAFVERVEAAGLLDCSFQISSDFKHDHIAVDELRVMIWLYGRLVEHGVAVIFFDDLIRHRLSMLDAEALDGLRAWLGERLRWQPIADSAGLPEFVIWGAGLQARYLMENARLLKTSRVAFFVDSTPAKIGSEFFGREVRDPAELRDSALPVLIAAAQAYPLICRRYREMGLPPERLVRQLII